MAWLDIPEQDEDSTATRTRNSVFAEALDDISFFLFGIKKLNPNRLVLASNGVQLEADHDKPKKTMGSNLHKNFFPVRKH
jgi:hypothetical protein